MEENTLVTRSVLQMLDFGTSNSNSKCKNYLFLETYSTLEGAVSHNVLYYQQLSID